MLSKKNQIYWYFIIRDWNIFYGFILLHDILYNIAAQFAEAGLIRKVSWLELSKSFGIFKAMNLHQFTEPLSEIDDKDFNNLVICQCYWLNYGKVLQWITMLFIYFKISLQQKE